jgi:hypothetical protein
MDIVDQAAGIEQLERDAALSFRHPVLLATGLCHNCQAVVHGRDRFCDAECCKDYNELERSRARLGIARR